MEPTFRAAMGWLHTWAGVILGGLLFAIFWMGTLSVFDREIDRWMAPASRLELPRRTASLDTLRPLYDAAVAAKAPAWTVTLPSARDPVFHVSWRGSSGPVAHLADPATGAVLPDPGTLAGTGFLYPFHHMLHIQAWDLGRWIVGVAGMAMLVLCVSGVVIHRRIFADFFTFRPARKPRRLLLDLHNVSGVVALPFHLGITVSGLVIIFLLYFPAAWQVAYRGALPDFLREAFFGLYVRSPVGAPGTLASPDTMLVEARRLWDGATPAVLVVSHPGDAASYVQLFRSGEDRVADIADVVAFDAASGALLHRSDPPRPIATAQRFISGLHYIQFRHWPLRWLYFGLGLTGCALIATGYLFWLEARRKKHERLGLGGVRVVEGLTVGSVTGIVIATLSFFAVNRLLPPQANWLGQDHAALEVWTFYLVWLASFGHAWRRPKRAWVEQCGTIAILAVTAVALNGITTGDHLVRSLFHRHLWAVAGMDLMLLAGATVAIFTAFRLRRLAAASGP